MGQQHKEQMDAQANTVHKGGGRPSTWRGDLPTDNVVTLMCQEERVWNAISQKIMTKLQAKWKEDQGSQ